MATAATLPPPPRQTANPAPLRPAGSVRRTCSIDVGWPDGALGKRLLMGRARDYLTPASGGEGRVLAEASMEVGMKPDKEIHAISAHPAVEGLHGIVGQQAGNHLRVWLRENLPDLIEQANPLYLALDDLSGTALVSNWTWAQWTPDWQARLREVMPPEHLEKFMTRANVCWGLKEGNSGLNMDEGGHTLGAADAGELRNPADPQGWHEFPEIAGPSFRRARRIDVTLDGGLIRIDASFQDSAPVPAGGRAAIHEYNLRATADAESLELLAIAPEPRILPFPECPGVIGNAQRLVGSALPAIRDTVLANLRGVEGCTHLNDALRALAEVPRLAAFLKAA